MKGKGEGCLATELQAIMALHKACGGPLKLYGMSILYNVYYKCSLQAIF